MARDYQICTRCVMDTTNPDIIFDENGVCNHCHEYETNAKPQLYTKEEGERKLKEIVEEIKKKGRGKEFDCIIGVSGGVDSTYAIYLIKKHGLRPLAVQFDNHWDSEIAAGNVERALKKYDVPLEKYTVDQKEFTDLQLAYLKASVIDIEAPTDHAIIALLFRTAAAKGIKYIISGTNIVTESMRTNSWGYAKNDIVNIKDIDKKFGSIELKTFPTMGILRHAYFRFVKGIKMISILNYVPYIIDEAKKTIIKELDWEDYGAKHRESIWTRFYQGYILPHKFNVDKRRAHLSNLIHSGQLSRDVALKEMEQPPYKEEELKQDKDYCIQKLGLTEDEFEGIMALPIKSHSSYKTDIIWRIPIYSVYKIFGGVKY